MNILLRECDVREMQKSPIKVWLSDDIGTGFVPFFGPVCETAIFFSGSVAANLHITFQGRRSFF